MWFRVIILSVIVVLVALKQIDEAVDEIDEEPERRVWFIFKRSLYFIGISLAMGLIVFAAGGGDGGDEELRRWDYGRP
jgi:hypothetical protein